jgi:tetratricopeptide (TPR) repeat protein
MRALVLAFTLVGVFAAPRPVHADPPATAAALYTRGEAEFRAGKIDDAIESFSRGYALESRPEFLLNLAQCYRALGRRGEAITHLERFIKAAPDHALRPNAERTLDELRRAEAIERVALAPKLAPSPQRSSRTWLWVTIGATVVLGASVAVYVGARGGRDVDDTIRLPP